METKPRHYRNNNASETVNVHDIRKPIVGRVVKENGVFIFKDATDGN